jgi:uncharacterized membrane protein
MPTINNPGFLNIAMIFICIPIEAIRTYKKTLAKREDPTPSRFLRLVNERSIPRVVAIIIIQKNPEVRLSVLN